MRSTQSQPKSKNSYYNVDRAFSYGALFHLIITERGYGKTFGFLIKWITEFYYHNHKTIMLAKFINEIDCNLEESYQYSIYNTINEINRDIDRITKLGLEFELSGRHILMKKPEGEFEIFMSFYAINNAEKVKKITELKTYKYMVHDECIRFDRYCKNEIDKLLTIYDTMNRRKTLDQSVRAFFLGNALTRFNPYTEHFGLNFKQYGYTFDKDRKWLVHISSDQAYQAERMESAITKMSGENSRYNDMASKGQFVYDDDEFVVESVEKLEKTYFALLINEKEITMSKFRNGYYLHTRSKAQRLFHHKYPSKTSVPIGKERLSKIKVLYLNGLIFFENIDIKLNFIKEYLGGTYGK